MWGEDHPREWDDVRSEALRGGGGGTRYTWDIVFGICVEQNSALDASLRKFMARVLCQGNQFSINSRTMLLSRTWAVLLLLFKRLRLPMSAEGCLGMQFTIADAEQAYIQADMKGDPTWVCLPPEARPAWWRKKYPHL